MDEPRAIARRVGIAFGVFVIACIAGGVAAQWRYGSGNFLVLVLAAIVGAGAYFEVRRRDTRTGSMDPGAHPHVTVITVVMSSMWVLLALSALLFAFRAGWWVAIGALILAWITWLGRSVPVSMASAAVAIGLTIYWLALIPSTTGGELVLALLAVGSAIIAALSARRVAELRTVAVAGLVAMLFAGCSVTIRTEERPAEACHAHPLRGTLVADEEHGVGLLIEGTVWEVVWPPGYSARRALGGVVLLGADVVAHEGDEIVSAGTGLASGDGLAHPCGKVMVVKRAGEPPASNVGEGD